METFDEFIINLKKDNLKKLTFVEYFIVLLKEKNLFGSDIYNKVNMSRQTYSKILNGQMKPSLKNAIKLALGLNCTNEECKLLLKKLDYTLASNSRFNLVIRYCLKYRIYDINDVNKMLYEQTKSTLENDN